MAFGLGIVKVLGYVSVQLVSKISYVVLIYQRYRQTDGQTDDMHAVSISRYALVHRAVKIHSDTQRTIEAFYQS